MLEVIGYWAVGDNERLSKDLAIHFCTDTAVRCEFCRYAVDLMTGYDIDQFLPVSLKFVAVFFLITFFFRKIYLWYIRIAFTLIL